MCSILLFYKEKNSFLKPVQNYQLLNEVVIKNKCLLPLIQELVNKIKEANCQN